MAMIRWMAGFDPHGDMQDGPTRKAFFEFASVFKPKRRICGGDLWNFASLRKGASDEEKRESLREDFREGKRWFNEFKPTDFLRGNHDERLWDLAKKDCGVASDYAQEMIGEVEAMVKHHRCTMRPYHKRDGILELGDFRLLHGFASGVNAVRQTALVYGSCVMGHVHAFDTFTIPGLERRVGRSSGCLCKTDMDYNGRQMNTLKQENGWIYGVTNEKTGASQIWDARMIGGKWFLPSEFVEL